MSFKIVSDSSSNQYTLSSADLPGAGYAFVPLIVHCEGKDFIDGPSFDVSAMNAALKASKKPSCTACPGIGQWLEAFGESDEIFAVTITGSLSGSYASAVKAAEAYREFRPGSKVSVIDSLSTGPEMVLLIEKILACKEKGLSFEETDRTVREYTKSTHLLFALRAMDNLAKSGRVSAAKAGIAKALGIRAIGKASDEGTLQMLRTCRGEKKTVSALYEIMLAHGYTGGRVVIADSVNKEASEKLAETILKTFPNADIDCHPAGALCSYYAEEGGILVGYEGN